MDNDKFVPPDCKCGHPRKCHEIEPPYPCYAQTTPRDDADMCDCQGYTIPVAGEAAPAPQAEAPSPHKFDPNTLICDNCGFVCDGQNNECPQAIGSVTGGSPAVQKLAAPQAAPRLAAFKECLHIVQFEQSMGANIIGAASAIQKEISLMEKLAVSQAEAPRPSAPNLEAEAPTPTRKWTTPPDAEGFGDNKFVMPTSLRLGAAAEAPKPYLAESRPSAPKPSPELMVLRMSLNDIPQENRLHANCYHTDIERVLHVWADDGRSWDVRWPHNWNCLAGSNKCADCGAENGHVQVFVKTSQCGGGSVDGYYRECIVESALDAELVRWQQSIKNLVERLSGREVDGTGCESGDALDVTLAEIEQGFSTVAESRPSAEEVEKLAREFCESDEFSPVILSIELPKAMATFWEWMQERITRP
jgi:hypothetical protein